MAVSCSPSDLIEGAKCYSTCLLNEELSAIELWLLTQIAGTTTDVQTLLNNSKCLENCVEHGNAEAVIVWLLTQIAGVNNDPNSLMSAAQCIEACIIPEESKAIDVSLEVQIAGSTSNLTTLLDNARCFRLCAADWRGIAIKIYLLATKAGVSTDPATLIGSANCLLGCLNHDQLKLIETYLWCQIANANPSGFSGLVNWWLAEDLVGKVADNGAVGDVGKTWTDRISGIDGSQSTAAIRPIFKQTGMNGKPAVAFRSNTGGSPAQQLLVLNGAVSCIGDYTTIGIFQVTRTSGVTCSFPVFIDNTSNVYHKSANNGVALLASVQNGGNLTFPAWSGSNIELSPHSIVFTRSGAGANNTSAYFSNSQKKQGTHNGNFTFVRLFPIIPSFPNDITNTVSEFLHYSRALSDAELTSLHNGYFKPRYGIP